MENKEEITLQETYQEIKDLKKINTWNVYRKALLDSYIYLAETSYNNYQVHKSQDEFMKALMDVEIINTTNTFSQHWDTKEIAFINITPFRRGTIYAHSSLLDFISVLTFSTVLVLVIWFLLKRLR